MSRGFPWMRGVLLGAVLLCPSCTTAVLWGWAGEEATAGHLAGVVGDGLRGSLVVYEFDDSDRHPGGTVAFRIPPDWRDLPVRSLVISSQGHALALAQPLEPAVGVRLRRAPEGVLRPLDYHNTIGRQQVIFSPGEPPLGFVALTNRSGEIEHELYGYDRGREQWVRLAIVNLGPYEPSGRRIAMGVALTPVALVVDTALFFVVVWALSEGGGNLSGLDFPSAGGAPEYPPSVAERDRYWQSLGIRDLFGEN